MSKIDLNPDDIYRFQEGAFSPYEIGSEPPTAKMDEIIVAIADEEMVASGGDCPIVTFFDPETRIAAVIHIDVEHLGDNHHSYLIKSLVTSFEIPQKSIVHILMDLKGIGKKVRTRQPWLDAIEETLKEHGFNNVIVFTEKEGKDTTLNAESGRLIVEGNGEEVILDHNYYKN